MKKFSTLLLAFVVTFYNLAYCQVLPGTSPIVSIQEADIVQPILFDDFKGGLNTRSAPSEMQLNELSEVTNMDLDEVGAIKTRKGFSRLTSHQAGNLLDAFNDTTGWTGSTDVTGIAKNTATYKEYDASIEFDKSGTTEAFGYIQKTVSLNLSTYDTSKFHIFFHIPATVNVGSRFVRFSSSGSDWKEYVDTSAASVGWNAFTITASSATTSNGTLNWSSVTTIRFGVNFTAAANTLNDIKVDAFVGVPETAMKITGLHMYAKENGTKFLLCSAGTNVYQYDTASTIFIPIITNLTSGLVVEFVTFKDLCFFVNGTDENKKFDGTRVTKMGIATPGSAPSPAVGAAGGLTGAYQYKVTFASAYHESNASVASSTVNPSSQQVNLTSIPTSSDTQVTKRILYRTKAGQATFFKLAEISDNTTTTYTDNIADTALGNQQAPSFQEPPPVFKYMASHRNYLFGAGHDTTNRNNIYVSKLITPEGWDTSEGFFQIQTRDGDYVRGIAEFLDSILVFKRYSLYVADGTVFSGANEDIDVRRVNTEEGTTSHRSITIANNVLYYFNQKGTFAFNGSSVNQLVIIDNIATTNIAYKIQPTIEALNQGQLNIAAGAFYNDKYWLSVADGSSTTQNTIFAYFIKLGGWTKYTNYKVNCWSFYEPSNTRLLYGGTNDGYVVQVDNGTNDAGTAISYSFTTPWFDLGAPNLWKRAMYYYVMGKGSGNHNITSTVILDKGAGKSQLVDVSSGGTTWNNFKWGQANWGVGKERFQDRIPVGELFNFIRFKINHSTLNQTVTIYGFELLYVPKIYREYNIT